MMSVADFFYGHREPVWIVHTPQSANKGFLMGTPPYIPATPPYSAATPHTPQTVNNRAAYAPEVGQQTLSQTVELKVPVCCEACEERVIHALLNCSGVESVRCDAIKQRVTITGTAAPADLLKICKKLHKRSELLGGNGATSVKSVKMNTPAATGGWTWNMDWSSRNTPAAISAWQ
ncbi:hypothetical protein R1flu_012786 [Riccia fluitans]|uniref:HMA domain-containing protein n=1 Tax=Riccia fluitans TaxID=41844 RepID=A0ABD1ZE27_9MARC